MDSSKLFQGFDDLLDLDLDFDNKSYNPQSTKLPEKKQEKFKAPPPSKRKVQQPPSPPAQKKKINNYIYEDQEEQQDISQQYKRRQAQIKEYHRIQLQQKQKQLKKIKESHQWQLQNERHQLLQGNDFLLKQKKELENQNQRLQQQIESFKKNGDIKNQAGKEKSKKQLNAFIEQHEKILNLRNNLLKQTIKSLTFKHLQHRLQIISKNQAWDPTTKAKNDIDPTSDIIFNSNDLTDFFENKLTFFKRRVKQFSNDIVSYFVKVTQIEVKASKYIKLRNKIIKKDLLLEKKTLKDGEQLIPISGTDMFLSQKKEQLVIKYLYKGSYLTNVEMRSLNEDQKKKIIGDTYLYLKSQYKQEFQNLQQQQIMKIINKISN